MNSLKTIIVRALLRLYTYPYRKKHMSLSRSVKFKSKQYTPPANFRFDVKQISGTDIEILSSESCNKNFAIVQFHGGGHTQKMNSMYRKVAEKLCKLSGCAVYSIDYKTGEKLVYPSVHEECFNAYKNLIEGTLKNKKIIAIGDSFGANVMLSACLKLRDKGLPMPVALISISCYIDLASSGNSYKYNCYKDPLYALPKSQPFEENEKFIRRLTPYCGTTPPYDIFLSPAYADFKDFPDMLIQCGDYETSASDSDTLYIKALNSGVTAKLTKYKGMWHDFQYLTPFLKESKTAWSEISEFINYFLRS